MLSINRQRQAEPPPPKQHWELKTKGRASAGFTLIELLVVIAILAVLAGVSFAALGQVRDSSSRAKCLANMRQLSAAYLLVVVDNNGVLIPSNEEQGGTATWYNLIEPYLGLNNAASANWISLCCPNAVAGLAEAGVNSSTTTSSRATYGLNSEIKANGTFSRMASLKTPSATVLLGDTHISNNKEWTTMGIQKSSAKAWHKEKCGVCFFDGHAEFVDQSFIKSTKTSDLFWKGVE